MNLMIISPETTTIISSIVIFLLFNLLLVYIILLAKAKLMPSGLVKITINGEEDIETEAGSSLLTTLSNKKIFLPSACGGGGTCAMCRCQVLSGGGTILSTETPYFTRKEQQENWRLGCQVKVKQDMEIKIPEEIFGIKKWECEVVSNDNVATYIKELVVKLPEGEFINFQSGCYIQIDVPACEINFKGDLYKIDERFQDDYDKFKIWDLQMKNPEPVFRAYSMANHPAEGNIIMLNIRLATPPFDRQAGKFMDLNPGICSSFVFSRKPGDKITIAGPFGDFHIKPTKKEMIYIGGGAGMAPLRSHLFHLFHTMKERDRKVSFWYGGRSSREIFYTEHFRAIEKEFPNFQYNIALSEPLAEDNWTGYTGFIHNVLFENYLKNHPEPEDLEYYICGPPMMNAAVFKMLDDLGVPPENIAFDDFGG
ncbi:MAG: NADH:ubiquinone reductase (Na(+)-transporting) subunit F [Sphingobacteriales bacterium 17-39-43]|uniref:NADH:ubiquinone reductase (Na(+)-transporting) subunit F n=1 Tax=Daejeonella sp. TaxID=2805397 RepID=UPI000BD5CC17|nr:NADH:ubiquinone reductase (Na(+)-transporting) subunit F [Daejeonella sp.]OYZ28881.1 MAG: NADH:ubiquinone reductase (Na(+)-transporting) subunit F [Sphingobacteriales bacterium 16-39-50]OZA22259.1 MAG: NADH:ubiquinone reductase (Na(+)-transporting) subunit F [Sphingobacteriales bacterium 17-39-43]HQT22488.1 NADH:ubiquinone reductase (Na(+)-transporting) subunit F [Daejeonella sp.]HQT59224.1 NADH:ubiquinone reductase (Na(+)-transporting) subunit F [Daejeonella sp.]